jgi:hypothetical protein
VLLIESGASYDSSHNAYFATLHKPIDSSISTPYE